jgi:hypothetical protein
VAVEQVPQVQALMAPKELHQVFIRLHLPLMVVAMVAVIMAPQTVATVVQAAVVVILQLLAVLEHQDKELMALAATEPVHQAAAVEQLLLVRLAM